MEAILELLRKFRSLISASVGTVLKCQPWLPLSQSWFSSRSKTHGYTTAVDLCLKGSKDQCGHPRASEESRRVSKYPEGKRAFKISSGVCGLVWLARASGLFTLAALREALPKSLLPRD
ncbi:hypothetical protein RF11_02100 [Thelohanellus kitauei]|uniref:Uncharacterized protein n=1 Tax=Thelohanellus kitauei TaxID=669202 RepID=A0A0C2ICE4_THEKT|nr:hypothetical protein RF11_02100 [Thelohanellus kitauei]